MIRWLKHRSGFTLMELLFVLLIISVLAVVGGRILLQGFRSYITGKSYIEAEWQQKLGMERLIRDLHNIPTYSSIVTGSTSATQFSYKNFSNATMTYSLSGTNLMLNSTVLATNVTSLAFAYYDKSGNALSAPPASTLAYIQMSLQIRINNISYAVTSVVYPWGLQ